MSTIRKLYVQCVVVLGLFGFFAGPAEAGILSSPEALNNAAVFATNPMFDSVGCFAANTSSGWSYASGVLISPEWVLTAGHVVTDSTISELRFYLGDNLYAGYDYKVLADAWYSYPGYGDGTYRGTGNDIALVHLSQAITSVTPASVYSGEDVAGTLMYIAGYGYAGTSSSSLGSFDGVKRAGENVADQIGWPTLAISDNYWLADYGPAWGTTQQPLEFQLTEGDSGGGWFANIDGSIQLVGVGSFYLGDYWDSGATRVSLYNDWINGTVSTSVPEPSSMLMLLTGGLSFLPFVKRKGRKQTKL